MSATRGHTPHHKPSKRRGTAFWITCVLLFLCIAAISLFFAWERSARQDNFSVFWPQRLSTSIPGTMAVSVWDKNIEHGRVVPMPNAKATLYQVDRDPLNAKRPSAQSMIVDGKIRKLAEGRTDARGFVSLAVPPVTFVPYGSTLPNTPRLVAYTPKTPKPDSTDTASSTRTQPTNERERTRHIELVLHIEADGEDIYVYQSSDLPQRTLMALSTDRPLYQPGQRVHLRSLLVDPDLGTPLQSPVVWEVRDPRGNLVTKKTTETSEGGISRLDFSLDAQCIQGQWQITASAAGISKEETIQVRPFRLPRFRVRAQSETASAQVGQPYTTTITGRTTYDAPVAGGLVGINITYTRLGGMSASKTREGKLNQDGEYILSWTLPEDAQPGSSLSIRARVTSKAGRSEETSVSVPVQGESLRVELLGGQGSYWSAGHDNIGYVLLQDGFGRPVANTEVSIALPEENRERTVRVTTDERGAARFVWKPRKRSGDVTLRMVVTPPASRGRPTRHKVTATLRTYTVPFAFAQPFATQDTPFNITFPSAQEPLVVVASKGGYPIDVQHWSGAGSVPLSFVFSSDARGLVDLHLFGNTGNSRGSARIWVHQKTTEGLQVSTDAPSYTPASTATLSLAFPPYATDVRPPKLPKHPVSFGVVGVDEALYALQERAQLPLSVLMHQGLTDVPGLPEALTHLALDATPQSQDRARDDALRSMYFQRSIQAPPNTSTVRTTYFTGRVKRMELHPWACAWAFVLLLLTVACVLHGARATWTEFSRDAWGWKRAFALIGAAVLSLLIGSSFLLASPDTLFGGLLVWNAVVLCWLIALAWRQRATMTLDTFLRATGCAVALTGAIALTLSNIQPNKALEIALLVGFGFCACILIIGLILWALSLHHKKEYKPAFGLATWISFALLPLNLMSVGLYYDESAMKTESAPMALEEAPPQRFVDFAQGDAPSQPGRDQLDTLNRPEANTSSQATQAAAPRVRNYFPETMVWLPEVLSDSDGNATLPLELPDSITTWRVNVSASTHDGRFGEKQLGLRVIQPFFLELDLPTHLTAGDVLSVPVTLVNTSNQPTSATLSLLDKETRGFALQTPLSADAVSVPAKGRTTVHINVRALLPGIHTLGVQATRGNQPGDAVQRTAQIAPDGRTLARSSSGLIASGWKASLKLPAHTLPGSVDTRVNLFPSISADATSGLRGITRKPTGCFEQTSSAHYPNVLILRALRSTPPTQWPGGEDAWLQAQNTTADYVSQGLQRILSYQNSDNGFGLYRGKPSNLMLTAYGLMQLSETHTVSKLDPNLFTKIRNHILARQNDLGVWSTYGEHLPNGQRRGIDDPGMLRAASFITWALASSPNVKQDYNAQQKIKLAVAYIIQNAPDHSAPDTLAIAANALLAAGHENDAKKVLDQLLSTVTRTQDTAYWRTTQPTWMYGNGRYADVETTALAGYALLNANYGADLLTPILRYLTRERSHWGGWGTTQATVNVLKTFERLRALSQKPADLSLLADNQPMISTTNPSDTRGKVTIKPGDPQQYSYRPPTKRSTHNISISSSTKTSTLAQLRSTFAVDWSSPDAVVSGERFHVNLKLSTRTATPLQAVQVTATITNTTELQQGATILELPIPPGAILSREDLEDWKTTGRIDQFEITPTHARLYIASFEPKAKDIFIYTFYPTITGSLSLPPSRAYAFYAPDPITASNSGDIRVTPQAK